MTHLPGITDATSAVDARLRREALYRSELTALVAACEKFGLASPYQPELLELSQAVIHAKQILGGGR